MGWAEGIDALLHRTETRPIGIRWAKAMHATLSEIEQVVVSEGIDCDFERAAPLQRRPTRRSIEGCTSTTNAGVGF